MVIAVLILEELDPANPPEERTFIASEVSLIAKLIRLVLVLPLVCWLRDDKDTVERMLSIALRTLKKAPKAFTSELFGSLLIVTGTGPPGPPMLPNA